MGQLWYLDILYMAVHGRLKGPNPLLSSAQFSPVAISGFCAAVTTGFLLSHTPPSTVMLFAMTAFTVGTILIATAPVHQTYWAQTFVSIIVMPWEWTCPFRPLQ